MYMIDRSLAQKERWEDSVFRAKMSRAIESRRTYPKGMYNSPTYKSWYCMLQRCNNPNNSEYFRYGARGIKVDAKWLTFAGFLKDMGIRPEHLTLDRIDSNANYTKENCKWSSPKEQANNTRRNRKITIGGETLNVSQWAERTGINPMLIVTRLKRGWSPERAVVPYNG